MTDTHQFNPFADRLSRDIRNALSSSLVECLQTGSISSAQVVADRFLAENHEEIYVSYINERLQQYTKAIETISGGSDDPFWRSLVLWDLKLFFEMHEVLEHAWYHATGDTKLIMQALIRAAGVYIKLECGLTPQARKIAQKSINVLEDHRKFLSNYFSPEILIEALKTCSPPPKLLAND
jgi:hypothetical protein